MINIPRRKLLMRFSRKGNPLFLFMLGSMVLVDFNAPLAGQSLTYDYTIEEMVEEPLDQLKGLVRLYAGRDMEIAMDGDKATVTLPAGINYDRRWLLWRGRIIHEGFELISGLGEIVLVETFKKPEKKEGKEE